MLLLGYELEDVLRVVVGIALGLLTIFRRELSCNRGYHPDDDDDLLSDSAHCRSLHADSMQEQNADSHDVNPTRMIRRRRSSSALLNMDDYDIQPNPNNFNARQNKEDPTEELLESAGLVLSGGPFLYMAIAMFDHLVFKAFVGILASVTSMAYGFRKRKRSSNLQQSSESINVGHELNEQNQQHLYSVAWNAATEYFSGISSKLDSPSSALKRDGQQYENEAKYKRSKSTGNLQHNLSDARTRALFREMISMANSGSMDVTLLPSDAQIVIFSFLLPQDVLAFTCTNKAGRNLLEDSVDNDVMLSSDEQCDEQHSYVHAKNTDTPMLIWKSLFQRDYSWVLSEWKVGKEAFHRSCCQQNEQPHPEKPTKVFQHLASVILDSQCDQQLLIGKTAELSSAHPTSSMKEFYFKFTETWLNYTLAGCNSTDKCLIGLHGHVFDISDFVEDHPGSTETLLLQAGRDATVFFESMGHSLGARKLAISMCAVVNGQCARWHFTDGERSNDQWQLVAGPLGPIFSPWGLMKPSCNALNIKRNIPGFLIPRKRSRPRFQGGLHRVREQIRQEEELQLANAARWGDETIGPHGMFGGVHVYYDPFCTKWKWWYTDRDFKSVFVMPPEPT